MCQSLSTVTARPRLTNGLRSTVFPGPTDALGVVSYQGPPGWGPPGWGYGPPSPGYGYAPMMAPHPPGVWTCPYCRWAGLPTQLAQVSKINTSGWITFFVLLFFCFPLCWLGLMMKDKTTKCPACGTPAGTV